MLDKVIFYNHWGAGDIFESREFVKEAMKKLPAEFYQYSHNKYPEILRDIPELGWFPMNLALEQHTGVKKVDNHWLINTWIGQDGKYVMPGVGCVIEKNYEMFNDLFNRLGISSLDKDIYDYIPEVNWSVFNTQQITKFIDGHPNPILICTGMVNSCQALNFEFNPILDILCKKYPNRDFITTTPMGLTHPNLFNTNEVTRTFSPDLNEIGYLSKFCKLIVGRNSGPFVFCQHKDNWSDSNKTFLSFTIMESASTFILSNNLPARKVWSGNTDVESVVKKIEEYLND